VDDRLNIRLDEPALDARRAAVAEVVEAVAGAAKKLSRVIAAGPLVGITGVQGGTNPDGDAQKDIDIAADRLMRDA
jgi:fructose-1,6-bisphosphatase I